MRLRSRIFFWFYVRLDTFWDSVLGGFVFDLLYDEKDWQEWIKECILWSSFLALLKEGECNAIFEKGHFVIVEDNNECNPV